MEDLWSDKINGVNENFPLNVLKAQAQLLIGKTKGLVDADVKAIKNDGKLLACDFRINIPALRYSATLFTVTFTHYSYTVYQNGLADKQIDTDEEFLQWFKECLGSDSTAQFVNQMVGMASIAE